jgi:hypothetical protein
MMLEMFMPLAENTCRPDEIEDHAIPVDPLNVLINVNFQGKFPAMPADCTGAPEVRFHPVVRGGRASAWYSFADNFCQAFSP